MPALILLFALIGTSWYPAFSHSIVDFGAIADVETEAVSQMNSVAVKATILAANSSHTDRTVLIPPTGTFNVLNITVSDVHNISLIVAGELQMAKNISWWTQKAKRSTFAMLMLDQCSQIHLTGPGRIRGQGYDWWWAKILLSPVNRPHMVTMTTCRDVLIDNLYVQNSPQFHFKLHDMLNLHMKNVTIHVDVTAQRSLLQKGGRWRDADNDLAGLPTFPLNTDGIDPAGANILIENATIQNFDDAVAVKPLSGEGTWANCSQNITVRNAHVIYSVGMTIGSVPPHHNVNCVRNVLFENIAFRSPIKAVYIKTNPGDTGTGLIERITYRHITANGSLWYPIWIGPQQQQQPGTSGTGCSWLYPIVPSCPTQPRVTVRDIVLQNMTFTNGLTLPGVVLCDPSNPCTGLRFDSVVNTGNWVVQDTYACAGAVGVFGTNNSPPLLCNSTRHAA